MLINSFNIKVSKKRTKMQKKADKSHKNKVVKKIKKINLKIIYNNKEYT